MDKIGVSGAALIPLTPIDYPQNFQMSPFRMVTHQTQLPMLCDGVSPASCYTCEALFLLSFNFKVSKFYLI